MKNFFLSAFLLVGLVLLLTFPTAVPAALAGPKPQPAAAAPAPPPHPEIRAAIDALDRARMHLQEAKHDFGGHRVDALKAIDAAQRQLNVCLKYDN